MSTNRLRDYERPGDAGGNQLEQIMAQGLSALPDSGEIAETMKRTIVRHPMVSLGAAFTIGICLGWLAKR